MTALDSLTPNQDERVMAALANVSAILPFMGVIAPIIIWVTQKDKSQFVAFQSLQALVYQLTMIVAWMVGMGCYMCSFFLTFLTIPFSSTNQISPSNDPLIFLTFFFPFLIFGGIFLGGFLFIIYGVVGAVMTIQGKPFRYVIIGRRVESFMQQKSGQPESQ
jgi:uncharacterized Tic20 family protein